MPRIFDNIDQKLLPALKKTLAVSQRADFCVGYFNLRGWKELDAEIEQWAGGDNHCCRLLIGMQRLPQDELHEAYNLRRTEDGIDQSQAKRLARKVAEEFRRQLTLGAPTNPDEAGLRRLARQLREKKLIVKLHLRHALHAKLYLLFRDDYNNPISGFLGSSNLTFAGLAYQGELNVDVLDQDACDKLAIWFSDRWNDRFCLDISEELIEVIENSWAVQQPTPYEVYLKIAYHLAQEARAGLGEFTLPIEFRTKLFKYQSEAVKIAARYLNRQGGVVIGDVVGMGKTLMATALAKIFEEDQGVSTLIICPKTLVKMWQTYVDEYGLRAKVMPSSVVIKQLPNITVFERYKLVVLDESHNYRNREGRRYRVIKEFIEQTDSRCILLSATPYNKSYVDLSAQLRLFVAEDKPLSIRPERLLREIDEIEFSKYQVSPNTLAAFEKSAHADDWRELMRLFLVRRTRSFIQKHYAQTDAKSGRKYLWLENGEKNFFPTRIPKTLKFGLSGKDADDPYTQLYSDQVVDVISHLNLPRYGLLNYVQATADSMANADEKKVLANLSRAGKRLIGYCRTGLFKRLESSGQAFVQSLDRHISRNYIFAHALDNGLPLPIGTQDAEMLDPGNSDLDADQISFLNTIENEEVEVEEDVAEAGEPVAEFTAATYKKRAQEAYTVYQSRYRKRFKWMRPVLFTAQLKTHLLDDAEKLTGVLRASNGWDVSRDRKLDRLHKLLTRDHADEKVLIFSQFADTVVYLARELEKRGVKSVAGATGQSGDPTALAWRFSPVSNNRPVNQLPVKEGGELRVLIATDVLSEGQNLQDAHIVVNYDLPWAIIRLIQRAGRVDRIGQKSPEVLCYSFLPADGVEQIIRLRARVTQRLHENGEVLGTDEQFFQDEVQAADLRDLYTEKANILDEADGDVDLNSEAYAIWSEATKDDPELARRIESLADVVFSTKQAASNVGGVLVYMRTSDGADSLAWINGDGEQITQSQLDVMRAAACGPDTPTLPRREDHHDLVKQAVDIMLRDEQLATGGLGPKSGARHKAYTRLKGYHDDIKARMPLFADADLSKIIDALYKYPLRETAKDIINRQIKAGISNEDLARLAINLRNEDRLSVISDDETAATAEARIICSMGLVEK